MTLVRITSSAIRVPLWADNVPSTWLRLFENLKDRSNSRCVFGSQGTAAEWPRLDIVSGGDRNALRPHEFRTVAIDRRSFVNREGPVNCRTFLQSRQAEAPQMRTSCGNTYGWWAKRFSRLVKSPSELATNLTSAAFLPIPSRVSNGPRPPGERRRRSSHSKRRPADFHSRFCRNLSGSVAAATRAKRAGKASCRARTRRLRQPATQPCRCRPTVQQTAHRSCAS